MGENWVIYVNDKVKHLPEITGADKKAWERHSIYKLPGWVTDLVTDRNKNVYKPRAVSFGPYHYGQLNLKLMEAHKERALLHFLNRSRKPLDYYIDALGEVVQDLKDAYDSLEDIWQQNSDAFLEMMIRDGCFMLEILRTSAADHQTEDDYADNDPLFSDHGKLYMLPYIKRDMLMLENQLPMLLLIKLHDVYKQDAQTHEESVDNLIVKFYFDTSTQRDLGKCLHVLDVHRTFLLWRDGDGQNQKPMKHCKRGDNNEIFPVIKLQESGIRIKLSNGKGLTDIQFDCRRGILRLPEISVDDASQTMFLNLIAFERFHARVGSQVTDYIFFMDKLINNSKDVDILESHKIIENLIGSDKAVAQLFHSLSEDIVLDQDGNLTMVCEGIHSYCKTGWHKLRASFLETHFRNPWVGISVVAAIVLFALTIAQTIYGALQYYDAHKTKK